MPELESISIKGLKSIAAVEKLPLGAINVVIGPNGSGKSNFIGVYSFLHDVRAGHMQDNVAKAGGAEKALHFGSKVTPTLKIRIAFQDEMHQYELELQPTEADELIPVTERAYYWNKAMYRPLQSKDLKRVRKEAGISADTTLGITSYVRDHLDRWRLYHFHDTSSTSPIKKTADIDDNRY